MPGHLQRGGNTLDNECPARAQGWQHLVLHSQAVAGADGDGLLPLAAVRQLNHTPVAPERAKPVFKLARQNQVSVHLEQVSSF